MQALVDAGMSREHAEFYAEQNFNEEKLKHDARMAEKEAAWEVE